MTASLFDSDEPPQAKRLAPALRTLAEHGVHLGTSSWKYEGWIGNMYDRDRYLTCGRLSKKKFEAECFREYAETFPTVGGDFSFYQFRTPDSERKAGIIPFSTWHHGAGVPSAVVSCGLRAYPFFEDSFLPRREIPARDK